MTDIQYQQAISTLDWQDLTQLWQAIKTGNTPTWSAGKAFEYLVIRMFELDGLKVKYPFSVTLPYNNAQLEQIDGVVYYDNLGILIESKDHTQSNKNVSIEPIAKLRNQLNRRPYLTIGCVFSATEFTEAVSTLIDYLGNETILLWTGQEVELCLQKQCIKNYLTQKIEHRIEYGIHDFNILSLEL